ncbi:flagellar hook-basal body complex protein FliE [Roseisolibacter sp. H3M3-2]|uniref:flagellar hook-basal body complex protein FliE n=1 Tax=Roseisolibacter sp. H3M3-2 TaxID=3031323 RepID=UPI0023D9B412|nr:flagellar hook-basal body complex protein FliE [Roseisolibacter sp. H3M3-2]MDF1504967.1 flagellar hook-basal body complex protein FliE [Roseisolibacter sp. H3M3-2]
MSDAIRGITGRMSQLAAYGQGPLAGLGGVGGLGDTGAIQVPAGAGKSEGPSFGDTLKQFVGGVSDAQDAAGELRDKFVRGDNVEMHQVMAAGEEAGIALEMLVELRNKVSEAYRTLVNMQ